MSTLLNQPVPKNIREQMIRRMETAPEDVVVLVHDVLLQIEKENLWQKIQGNASEDAKSGKLDRVGEIIQNYRDTRRSA
jgi:predicted RNase H-like nuclease (RuvC/YqgF family)